MNPPENPALATRRTTKNEKRRFIGEPLRDQVQRTTLQRSLWAERASIAVATAL
ncbi:MAG: hypothetical protein P4L92_07310 [Rudaea sp.]|nr:hypothetical protein [Rudaea sp.]